MLMAKTTDGRTDKWTRAKLFERQKHFSAIKTAI